MKPFTITILLAFLFSGLKAQLREPAQWNYELSRGSVSAGEEVDLLFNVSLEDTWYVYSTDFVPTADFGPVPTKFTFEPHPSYELVNSVVSENSKEKTDDLLGLTFRYMDQSPAIFRQRVRILSDNPVIKGSYEYQVCTLVDGMCIPGDGVFDFNVQTVDEELASSQCAAPKYTDLFKLPYGLTGYFDLDQAKQCAKVQNKPLFIDFTGHGCVNCRVMEKKVWADPEVLERLRENYVIVALYVDDKTVLPEEAWYVSTYDGKTKKTIGKQNADYQIVKYINNAQPFYVLMDHNENLLTEPKAFDLNVQNFIDFLETGINEFEKRNNQSN